MRVCVCLETRSRKREISLANAEALHKLKIIRTALNIPPAAFPKKAVQDDL